MSVQEAREPKYRVVADHLGALLDELGEGAAIPPERELAQRFEVSRVTVRQAVQELLVAGRLRRQGRGTVVAGPKVVQALALGSYTEGLRDQGRRPGRRLVTSERIAASDELAAELDLREGASVVHLERVLLADDLPVGLEDTYLPEARFPRLLADFDPSTSLYVYLRGVGTRFDAATERIETVLAAPREAQLLATNPGAPMLLLNRITLDSDGRPVERVRSLFRGDRFSFVTTLRAHD
ncbi:GntR family transcriptional regulator [Pseudonocardia spinosispora]|uniref:GntR family transcriptional regulator n=1 Tax=Pseudonocardia spinosispora TaxID=103441 RepID=UPI0004108B00|nr:GntR family transcriptional regulator [Pseudonocardia spinosispora]